MSSTITLSDSLIINQIEQEFAQLSAQFNDSENEIILDAEAVDTVDTSGLQCLLMLIQNAAEQGKTISWLSPSETIKTSAEKLGLSSALKLV
ncbi:STAS domain-containing protein [Thiomicrorhabdus sp. 6S2-11]|jgi:anti-anti-sigma regulatory factor|uniref:STAS domain-containing protein n=1 Tax=Thiomicrorhabdus marina TaxID=2818442 RepID=A0ABS3Q8D4_9GAMM|nr:STAS domain-containing protein [Thiomicrorhabdus marina]MBO1928343.1 STAS domain-containing protein [Thiomicrorhabdus marina]